MAPFLFKELEDNKNIRQLGIIELSKLLKINLGDLRLLGEVVLVREIESTIASLAQVIIRLEKSAAVIIHSMEENFNNLFDEYLGDNTLSAMLDLSTTLESSEF